MVGFGVLAGVPDTFVFHAGRAYALEIKTESGRLSSRQQPIQMRLRAAGVIVNTTYGLRRSAPVFGSVGAAARSRGATQSYLITLFGG